MSLPWVRIIGVPLGLQGLSDGELVVLDNDPELASSPRLARHSMGFRELEVPIRPRLDDEPPAVSVQRAAAAVQRAVGRPVDVDKCSVIDVRRSEHDEALEALEALGAALERLTFVDPTRGPVNMRKVLERNLEATRAAVLRHEHWKRPESAERRASWTVGRCGR